MRPVRTFVVWGQLLVTVVAGAAGIASWLLADLPPEEAAWSVVPFLLFALTASAVGALMLSRRRAGLLGILLAVVGVSAAVTIATAGYVPYRIGRTGVDRTVGLVAWVGTLGDPLAFHLIGAPFLLLFPTGRLPSRRWRWLGGLVVLAVAASLLGTAFTPGPLPELPVTIDNPFGWPGAVGELLPTVGEIGFSLFALAVFPAVASVWLRYRAAGPDERHQIKWMGYAGGMLLGSIVLGNVLVGLGISSWDSGAPIVLVSLGMAAIPAATGIAVLRYRLYEIDRIISRTVSYTLLAAALAGVFAVGVVAVPRLLRIGDADWLVAATTLVAAALFNPLRRRVQVGVDRRFNRARYEAEQVLDGFRAHLREELDPDAVSARLAEAVGGALQPASVGVWLARNEPVTPIADDAGR